MKEKKLMSSPTSKNLKIKYEIKRIPIRRGDYVIILRGNQKGKLGKITQCSRRNFFIFVENVIGVKTSNMNYFIQINPSNVLVSKINLTDTRKEKFLKGNCTYSGKFDNKYLDLNALD
mmetsp:Transcript_10472/g.23362  ORF Transcript_10472/g.23362 Transcript_10472/m.23362 type:complete len:118 (+) Transcript_10472:614-967(+)